MHYFSDKKVELSAQREEKDRERDRQVLLLLAIFISKNINLQSLNRVYRVSKRCTGIPVREKIIVLICVCVCRCGLVGVLRGACERVLLCFFVFP